MKKKLIAVFLIVATLLTCAFAFAACDKDKGKGNGAGETYTEEEIATMLGKIATYILTQDNEQQMNFEVPSEEERNESGPVFNACEWLIGSCIYVLKYDTAEKATAAIENVKEEFGPMFEGDGEFTVEQHGAILIVGGKDRIDAIKATEDKSVELLSQEFIDQYKANLKLLLGGQGYGYQSFALMNIKDTNLQKGEKYRTIISNMRVRGGQNNSAYRVIRKLANDATAEEIKEFNDDCSRGGYGKGTKINDKLWFFVGE